MAKICDLVQQTGCGPNEKCVWDGTGNSCASKGAGSPLGTGTVCMQSADACVAGDECLSAPMSSVSLCVQYCNSDGDCKQPPVAGIAPQCTGFIDSMMSIHLCSIACNPYNAADGMGCPPGLACTYQVGPPPNAPGPSPAPVEGTDCLTHGTGGDGADCSTNDLACAPGFYCVHLTGSMGTTVTCRQVCQAGQNGQCACANCHCNTFPGVANPKFGVCF
jgi:hypothetical protein